MATGLGKGLAVRHDFGADIDRLYKQENLRSQIRVEKERKAQMYGEMLKGTHVRGKYNTKRLEEYYNDLNGKVANFVTENPGWETDPGLFAEFSSLSDQYLNNPIIQEDLQVQANFEALQQKVASGSMSIDDINSQMDAYSNYIENGGDPYVFVNPKEVDYNELVGESARLVGHETRDQTRTLHGITQSRTAKAPVDGAIDQRVKADFSDKDNARSIIAGYNQAGGKAVADTPQQWHFNNLKAAQNMDATQWHFDRYELALATKRAQGASVRSMYRTYIFDALQQAVESGQDADFSARPANAVLTSYGGLKATKYVTDADDFKFSQPVKEGEATKYTDFNHNAFTKSLGAGNFVVRNGLPYVEMDVMVGVPLDEDGNVTDTKLIENLEAHGFGLSELEMPGMFSVEGLDKQKIKAKYYQGTLLAPTIQDEMVMNAFDDSVYGAETMQTLQSSGQYGQMERQFGLISAEQKYPGYGWKESGEYIVSADGKYRINPSTRIIEQLQ